MKWTTEQREAIEYRGKNILLAAAAGSGKTAVLVQRIIELVRNDKISLDELLVLTFTEAAASEMREKIKKAILSELKKNPDDEHLRKQRLIMHASSISTVHSFCLNTLKNNIQMTDLPVDFALVDETENAIIIKDALDAVLEKFYKNIDKDSSFANLVVGYGGIKNDSTLRERVLALYSFSRSMAYPQKWLNAAVRAYGDTARCGRIEGEWWNKQIKMLLEESQKEIFEIYTQIIKETASNLGEEHPYFVFLEDEFADLKRVFEHIGDFENYTDIKSALDSFSHSRMASGWRKAEEYAMKEQARIKGMRDVAKGVYKDLCDIFVLDEETVVKRISLTYPAVKTLKNIVIMLDRRYMRKKREKKLLDFNDLEHETLKLLLGRYGEETEVAKKLRAKYKMILVDEYQDTNNIQDLIFRTISDEDKNIFMVGDLKQSIYKFRNAVPKLFSDKYELYGKIEESGHLIRLFKNFRSRDGVVDTVNFVFQNIMSPEVGNINYTKEEYLVRGSEDYPKAMDLSSYDTEFHLILADGEDGGVKTKQDKVSLEARIAALRIKEMIDSEMLIFDKEQGAMRPIRYKDIVVLMRKTKDEAPIFESVFEESSIPTYSDVGHSYLESLEIHTVLAYLQIIDNPRQDIPLIAVLRSPIWGFSAEELADIRIRSKEGCFFDALTLAAKNGDVRSCEFISQLEVLRQNSERDGVDKLLYSIYYECGYYAFVGALSHGKERQANLRVLMERATEFEHTKMSGLFSFMNYIETMRSENKDMTPAKAFGEGEDVVRIMSIHKSKGLEFPVVILSNTSNEFNLRDASNNIIWDEQGGIGMDFVDTNMRVRYLSLAKSMVGLKLKKDMLSEEMRLLYVALTRAREKLIITATFKSSEKKWKNPVWREDGTTPQAYVRGLRCYKDWLCAAFMRHEGAKNLREYCEIPETVVDKNAKFGFKTYLYKNSDEKFNFEFEKQQEKDDDKIQSFVDIDKIYEMLEYEYPQKERCMLPVKLSVSEIKRMHLDESEYVPLIDPLRNFNMSELKEISGAEKGTIVHFVMQMIKPQDIKDHKDVERLVEKLKEEGIVTIRQAEAVDCKKIADFFLSPLGERLKNAVRCEREFSFYTYVTADEIYKNGQNDKILLQGIMDCFFVEKDGRTVLLDFKTDRAENRDKAIMIAKKYRLQMKYYKKALTEILERAVDECYLYFLDCGELVSMNEED